MNIKYLEDNKLIIFKALRGSHAYGTNLPTSDIDYIGIFILPQKFLYGTEYIPQVNDSKNDEVYYEIRKFIELLTVNNPTILEILNMPADCIVYKHPVFDLILEHKDKFITKQCKNSFAGYAKSQITKATGLNKMQNWEAKKVNKKTPLDFCYIIEGHKSYSLKNVLKNKGWNQKFCGLTSIPHARDMYALFYDHDSAKCFDEKKFSEKQRDKHKNKLKKLGKSFGLRYKGIEIDNSNKIRLSSIPKSESAEYIIYYNEDGYTQHIKDWKSYQTWLKERNVNRYVTNKEHGQMYDSKNIMHLKRLLDMSKEIAEGKGVVIRRPNINELISIRNGEVSLKNVLTNAEKEIKEIDMLFNNSNLPETVDKNFMNELLIKVRTKFYEKSK